MISRLSGRLLEGTPGRLVVDVNGVGYEVLISLTTFAALPKEGPVSLHIHTHVREAELTLFGFADVSEKTLFMKLQTVAGIGPRLALGILSQMPAAPLAEAIQERDVERLVTLPGVGKRTAERIVTELSEKMAEAGLVTGISTPGAGIRQDARLALMNLGYRQQAVEKALDRAMGQDSTAGPLEEVVRRSLKILARR